MDGHLPADRAATYEDIYHRDFIAWSREQVELLRQGHGVQADWVHIADALEDFANGQVAMAKAALVRVMEHLLKLEVSPAQYPRNGWHGSAMNARTDAILAIEASRRLRDEIDLDRLYRLARKKAVDGLTQYREADAAKALPETCPYTLDQILDLDFFPANRHGLE